MADSIDRVFGHALNTVNKIRPGSQKPPLADRQELYGLYKQSMEGDVTEVAPRPTMPPSPPDSASASAAASADRDHVRKEQEKWDAWRSNDGLSRTEAKRRYIEKLIETMHKYASATPEARELVEELEFVWDQIKSNSQPSSSEHSSPLLQHPDRGRSVRGGDDGAAAAAAAAARSSLHHPGHGSSATAVAKTTAGKLMRVLSPVSQAEEEEMMEDEGDEFVDAPVSQVDGAELEQERADAHYRGPDAIPAGEPWRARGSDRRWRRKMESGLMKLTVEVAALREQLESSRYFKNRSRNSVLAWVLRLSWWAVQLFVADAVLLWIVILYMRRKQDHRLEMAVRVLLGDAVAQVQRVGNQVKMPTLPRIPGRKPS